MSGAGPLAIVMILTGIAAAEPKSVVVDAVAKLRDLDGIVPATVAKQLGAKLGTTRDVTPYRHETALELAHFSAATVVVGGQDDKWRIVSLEPDPKTRIALAELAPVVGALPHTEEPRSVHTSNGLEIVGTSHHFRTSHLELTVDLDGKGSIERIVLSTEQTVPAKAPPLTK